MRPQGMGYRNNSELTEHQLSALKLLLASPAGVLPESANHSRTLRSLVGKGFASRKSRTNRYFITDAGVDRLGPRPHNATRSMRGA